MYTSYIGSRKRTKQDYRELVGKTCCVMDVYTKECERCVIDHIHSDGYSEHVAVITGHGDILIVPVLSLVFMSKPIKLMLRDVYGEIESWEESEIAWRD